MDSKTDDASRRTAALAARYGAASIPPAGPWNDTIAQLLSHRSVRAYLPDPLPEGTLETLIAAAQSAATSSNMQTWSVIAVTDAARKVRVARLSNDQMFITQAPLFLAFLADLSRAQRVGDAGGVEMGNLAYLETFMVAAIDAALAAQNAVVAAESLGLSTVYIGSLRNDPVAVADELDLPNGAVAVFGLCVGWGKGRWEVKPRLAQAAVLHRETYRVPDETTLRAAYDKELRAFAERNEIAPYTWTERVKTRFGRLADLRGRERMREALTRLGFPLR
ncbi:MAG: nitroreductase family protein [Rhizomicrobium sp.]